MFARSKTVWTLSSLWTQRTRPQVTLKTAQTAVFNSAHTDHFFLQEEENNEETNDGNTTTELSTESDHSHSSPLESNVSTSQSFTRAPSHIGFLERRSVS
jgi:hypothetical protein